MRSRFLLVLIFFLSTPIAIIALAFYSTIYNNHQVKLAEDARSADYLKISYLDSHPSEPAQETELSDPRVDALHSFLIKYKSPLTDYAEQIVATADKYAIDYRLLPAIAMQESILCKRIPKHSYNCWGYGIYGGKVTRFDNFTEAIEKVSKTLASYNARGLQEPFEIMSRYTPNNTNDWAGNVTYFMGRIASSL